MGIVPVYLEGRPIESGMNTPSNLPPDHSRAGRDSNPDPITGQPGSHPVGTGVGAAGGGTAGAAIGAMAGPVGAVVGAAVGAVAGGLAGKAAGEAIDPTGEVNYWRENHAGQPYSTADDNFADYEPAYRAGVEARSSAAAGTTWDQAETKLSHGWEKAKGESRLAWDKARNAARAAWDRVDGGSARSV